MLSKLKDGFLLLDISYSSWLFLNPGQRMAHCSRIIREAGITDILYYKGDVSEARKGSFRWKTVRKTLKGNCHLFLVSL